MPRRPNQREVRGQRPDTGDAGRVHRSEYAKRGQPWGLIDVGRVVDKHGRGDRAVAAVAAAQHSAISAVQLIETGISRTSIAHRARTGRLHRIHRGVYAVGHGAVTELGLIVAALLACGPGSVISHRSAAWLWGMTRRFPRPIDVSVPRVGRRPRDGIRIHRISPIHRRDLRRRERIPVTGPERTILDLAEVEEMRTLERALNQARVLRLLSDSRLAALKRRAPGRHGWRPLTALFEAERTPGFDRSQAERLMLELVRRGELPMARRNVVVHGHEIDLFWRAHRLGVEIDGFASHSTRAAFDADRARDAELESKGITVIRFTWTQLIA